jgi:hypothetical protein
MNADDFEKKLQQQPLRQVPGDWREEILRTAQAAVSEPDHAIFVRAGLKLWRELIWPCRHVWAGLAALWLVLGGINAGMSTAHGVTAPQTASAPAPFRAIEEQRRMLAELIPPIDNPPAAPPRRVPAPRSDRRTQLLQA